MVFVNLWGSCIHWQPPNFFPSRKASEIRGIVLFCSGIYKQPQSKLILLHPSVTITRTRTDARFINIYELLFFIMLGPLHFCCRWRCNHFHPGWKPKGKNVLHLSNPLVLFPWWLRQGACSKTLDLRRWWFIADPWYQHPGGDKCRQGETWELLADIETFQLTSKWAFNLTHWGMRRSFSLPSGPLLFPLLLRFFNFSAKISSCPQFMCLRRANRWP